MIRLTFILGVLATVVYLLDGVRFMLNEWRLWQKRRTRKRVGLLCLVGLLGVPSLVSAATYVCGTDSVNDSCTRAGMTTLLSSASNGDTIRVATATHDWVSGNPITISKRVRITGSRTCTGCGTNSPSMSSGATLVFGNGLDAPSTGDMGPWTINVTGAGSENVELDGIRYEGDLWFEYHWWDTHSNSAESMFFQSFSTNIAPLYIHDNHFHALNQTGDGDGAMNGGVIMSPAVISKNIFEADGIEGHTLFITDQRTDGNGDAAWAETTVFGGSLTNRWVFIETNTFIRPSGPVIFESSVVDAYAGGRYVFRYNYVRNGWILNHDKSGGGESRAGVAFEVYNNTFNFQDAAGFQTAMYLRDGAMLYYNNSHVGFWQSYMKVWNRRIGESQGNWGLCNGSQAWDSNIGPGGRHCADQVGTGAAGGIGRTNTQPQALLPTRLWSNTGSTTSGCAGTPEHGTAVCNSNPTTIIDGTDYIFSTDASAAPGGYSAYTYPHPFAGEPPAAGLARHIIASRAVQIFEVLLPVLGIGWHFRKVICASGLAVLSVTFSVVQVVSLYAAKTYSDTRHLTAKTIVAFLPSDKGDQS